MRRKKSRAVKPSDGAKRPLSVIRIPGIRGKFSQVTRTEQGCATRYVLIRPKVLQNLQQKRARESNKKEKLVHENLKLTREVERLRGKIQKFEEIEIPGRDRIIEDQRQEIARSLPAGRSPKTPWNKIEERQSLQGPALQGGSTGL